VAVEEPVSVPALATMRAEVPSCTIPAAVVDATGRMTCASDPTRSVAVDDAVAVLVVVEMLRLVERATLASAGMAWVAVPVAVPLAAAMRACVTRDIDT
jgi:hypothetical protein